MPLRVQNEPILYKYVVDGEWRVNPDEKITKDFEGNENNVLDPEDLKELVSIPGSLIPESGLIYNNSTTKDVEANDLNRDATVSSSQGDYKTTVMPKEEPHQTSLTGEPGIHIPKGKDQLAAFEQYENTDPKALNEDVKEIGTANTESQNFNQGTQIPQDTSAFEKFEDTDPKALNEDEAGTTGVSNSKDLGTSKQAQDSESASAGAIAAAAAAAGAVGAGAGAGATAADSSSTQGDNLKKVKRVEYKSKPKQDATGIDQRIDSNTGSKDAEFVPVPAAIETGNEASSQDYKNDPKVTPGFLNREADANDEINKEVRDEFESPKHKDANAPAAVQPEDEQQKDHSTGKTLGAAALGGVGGAGLGSALASDSNQQGDLVHGPFSTSKEAKQSVSDPTASTAPVVVDDAHPITLDPKAGQDKPAPGTTAPSTLASEPEIKPVTGSDLGEGKEVNASPVAKDQSIVGGALAPKSRVTAPTTPPVVDDEGEEEIIIAQGNQDDILAAVEATEGHDVTLEEITPTKSEQERLTKEAQLASQVDGPITIEQVVVPEEEVLSSKGSTKLSSKDNKASSTATTTATSKATTPKKQIAASEVPVKTTKRTEKGKEDEEKKKKGFRTFLKKIVL